MLSCPAMSNAGNKAGIPPTIIAQRGLHLLGSMLWFDATAPRELCFASSASLRRPGQHRKVLCTTASAALFTARDARLLRRFRALTSPYGRPVRIGPLRLSLLPSGRLLGGAQLLVEHEGWRVLYTGSLCPAALPTAAPAEEVAADLVVAPTNCLAPGQSAPDRQRAAGQLVAFAQEGLASGRPAVVRAEALGPAQDALTLLLRAGLPVSAHRGVHRFLGAYAAHGHPALGEVPSATRTPAPDRIVVAPPAHVGAVASRALEACFGEDPGAPGEQHIPWSGRATADELIAHILATGARHVVLHGEHDVALAARLRRHGKEATALSSMGQLSLHIP